MNKREPTIDKAINDTQIILEKKNMELSNSITKIKILYKYLDTIQI